MKLNVVKILMMVGYEYQQRSHVCDLFNNILSERNPIVQFFIIY